MSRALALIMAAVLALACKPAAEETAAPQAEAYPGTLVPTGDIAGAFMARQTIIATYPEGTSSFEAVLQLHDGALTLVGLTPFGTRAFSLQQRGTDVTLEVHAKQVLEHLRFPPRYALLDIHRTFFMGVPGAPLADGEHTHERAGEVITEGWADGRLHTRGFRRTSGTPAGVIEITYRGGMVAGEIPETIDFRNGWLGYRLTIKTLSVQELPGSGPSDGDGS